MSHLRPRAVKESNSSEFQCIICFLYHFIPWSDKYCIGDNCGSFCKGTERRETGPSQKVDGYTFTVKYYFSWPSSVFMITLPFLWPQTEAVLTELIVYNPIAEDTESWEAARKCKETKGIRERVHGKLSPKWERNGHISQTQMLLGCWP